MSSEEIKLCKDCKHYREYYLFGKRCRHPNNILINRITGKEEEIWPITYFRSDSEHVTCKEEGIFWEAKE